MKIAQTFWSLKNDQESDDKKTSLEGIDKAK